MRTLGSARRSPLPARWRSASPPAAATTRQLAASSGTAAASAAPPAGGTHQRRRRDVPAARLPASGRRASRSKTGTTVNYQGIGSGGGIAQFTAGTVDFGAHRLGDERRGDHGRREEGRRRSTSRPSSAPSPSSYNVDGVETGLKLDGATIADIFLGKIKKWNDPAIAALNPGVELPGHRRSRSATAPTSRARPRTSPTFLADYSPGVGERPGRRQVRQVADRHRRQGQRRRRRLRQADRRRGRLRRAGLRAAEQLHVRRRQEQGGQVRRADARVDLGRRRGPRRSRTTCASATINAPAPTAYPITVADVPARLQGHVQGRPRARPRPSA